MVNFVTYLWTVVLFVSCFPLGAVLAAEGMAVPGCDRFTAVYRDADDRGFEFRFGPPRPTDGGGTAAVAAITYRGEPLHQSPISVSNGYSAYYFKDLRLDFFNQDFTFSGGPEPPAMLFVSGLGSYDYYARRDRTPDSPPYIYETFWLFDRCQD